MNPTTRPPLINKNLVTMALLAVFTGLLCYLFKGTETFTETFTHDLGLLLFIAPKILAAPFIAAFGQMLLPRHLVSQYVGDDSGITGNVIATTAGAITPGGPMTSFPFVHALHQAGVPHDKLVNYTTSWSLLGLQQILVWELPFVGPAFVLHRIIAALPLPFIAGYLSLRVPPKITAQTPVPDVPETPQEPDTPSLDPVHETPAAEDKPHAP